MHIAEAVDVVGSKTKQPISLLTVLMRVNTTIQNEDMLNAESKQWRKPAKRQDRSSMMAYFHINTHNALRSEYPVNEQWAKPSAKHSSQSADRAASRQYHPVSIAVHTSTVNNQ